MMSTVLDETLPKNRRSRVRVIVGIALTCTMAVVWTIVVALSTGLPLLGAVAWASDVDKKIQAAVDPIKDQVNDLEKAVKIQTKVSNSLLASVAASNIRATYARLYCSRGLSDLERERLNNDLDRYIREYPDYTDGRNFPMDSLRCNPS